MEWPLTPRVNRDSASSWNSLAQWTRWRCQTRETGLKERNLRTMNNVAFTSTLWTILAPSSGDPGNAHKPTSQLEHAAFSRKSNFKTDSAFTGKPETKSERLRCQKCEPCWILSSSFCTSLFFAALNGFFARSQLDWPIPKRHPPTLQKIHQPI